METAPEVVEEIFNARSADAAEKTYRKYVDKMPADWAEREVAVMQDICMHKLQQHPYIQRKLLQTLDLPLVEDSPKDDVWGWGPNHGGRNELGKVWMRLREWFLENTDEQTKADLLK